jgi:siroheme synthase (precorrin-2 oxidase/ferrochelatase)
MKRAPEVLPPAFYPVGLNLNGRTCVVIGPRDDREAVEKAAALRAAGASVRALEVPAAVGEADVADAFLVVSTPQDAALSARLAAWALEHRFLLCTIDQPAYGFVAMQAIVAAGPARIAISTGGVAPRVGGVLRERLQTALDGTFARFLACLAHQRRLTRARHPDDPAARRAAMIAASDGFEVEVTVSYPNWFDAGARCAPHVLDGQDGR